jgi:hypothetical protein
MRVLCEGCGLAQTNRIHRRDDEHDDALLCPCRRCNHGYATYVGRR